MQTGENEQALKKVIDFTRFLSILVLLLHYYFICYGLFRHLHITHPAADRVLANVFRLGIFRHPLLTKSFALLILLVSLSGSKGKKEETVTGGNCIAYCVLGILLFYCTSIFLDIKGNYYFISILYISLTTIGYLAVIYGASRLFRIISANLKFDIFNNENETFPQEERLLNNEFSINLPAEYYLKSQRRKSWINIINPFRGSLILGSPGAGKSYFVIRHIITQHIQKGFSMFLYDFKFADLSRIAYNALLQYAGNYSIRPRFYAIDFDHIKHCCNPLEPGTMHDIMDAMESARIFMLGLNREWIKKQGDFFVESPINFVTAIFWFLKKFENGRFCTIPHAIELAQVDYKDLFALLKTEPEIEVLINPFISAWQNEASDQLEGQIASAKISLARLSSPQLYYVLSKSDFTLDINNPEEPKIVCVGNNPQKQQVYGAVLSLYVSRMIKQVNQKGKLKSSLIFDEFPTIYVNNMDSLIATARSNKVATTLAVQDYSQLKKDYGREHAEVIMNIVGNVISGQVNGDTAKQLSERFGKIMQERQSLTLNSQDTSVNKSTQLDFAVPASTISSLSSGEFVGMVADDPSNKINQKVFHSEIINDHQALKDEEMAYKDIPNIRKVTDLQISENFAGIRMDIEMILKSITI
ncbi:conjugal transfer protein MobC [Mucilaginibacter ginkgonis]|uniref:YWFCY domain-containing protein n=1 Tax=Mucilaginibacter ginkgonis TaxID=2682091 RepID=A0A6I4IMY4_9SPHI|nr:conjugal transfer protein MobC [Mucilaginibacter ginkgonis]QQL49888.1 YWFCY domain-containing protein [Mucilaginibacter ginkgonis]